MKQFGRYISISDVELGQLVASRPSMYPHHVFTTDWELITSCLSEHLADITAAVMAEQDDKEIDKIILG